MERFISFLFFCQIDVWKFHSNIEKLGKALCMGLKAYQSCFYWGFIKKRQKYGTLSKDFLGFIVTPKEENVKKYNKCFAFLYYWKRSRTDDWEENLTNMFHYSGNYLPRNTEWSVNTFRVACPFENRSLENWQPS